MILTLNGGKSNFRKPLENKMMIKIYSMLTENKKILAIGIILMISMAGCAGQVENKTPDEAVNSDLSKVIDSITTEQSGGAFNIYLRGSQNLNFTSVKQPFPTGVILYFPNTKLDNINTEFHFESGIVETIKASEYNQEKQTSRIEILLREDVGYKVSKADDGLLIAFKGDSFEEIGQAGKKTVPDNKAAIGHEASEIVNKKPAIELTDFKSSITSPVEQPIPVKMVAAEIENTGDVQDDVIPIDSNSMSGKMSWMNRIDFSSETNGKSTLIIGTTVPVRYEIKKTSPTKVELQLKNTNIPKYRQRPLITTRFQSAVDRILPFQTAATGESSVISIELRENVPYYIEQTNALLMVHFEASSVPPRPLDEANLPDWQQVIMQTTLEPTIEKKVVEPGADEKVAEADVPLDAVAEAENDEDIISVANPNASGTQAYAAGEFGTGRKKYIGEKIALDFYKTDIKNVFRILREISGKNFAIDKDVSGSVTLTLDKPVPWDQVMDLVLKMNQLGMIYEQDIIRIATLETLRREEDQRSAQLAAAKKAQQQKESLEPIFTEYIAVNYSQAASEVLPHVQNVLTKERGSATVDGRNNQIIITDTRDAIRQAREIVRKIDKVTPQVVIEARIVEVSSSFSRELGIEWNADYGATYSDVLDMDFTGNLAMNFPSSGATSGIGINFSRLDGLPFVLNAKINALETQGDGKILSSPKIVTLDNKKARIKQGLEYPYLERDDSGGSSVKFKNIDLLLEVTPHVTPDNRISMSIFITKNDVAAVTDGVPSIATNEAETELLVNDGDTIVIGGIIKASENRGESGFPGLSRIPIIGWLFKNETHSDQKNELLIFMTPRIVQLEQL